MYVSLQQGFTFSKKTRYRKCDASTKMSSIIVTIHGSNNGLQSIVRPTIKNNAAKIPNDAHSKSIMLNITVAERSKRFKALLGYPSGKTKLYA